jgi:hypothetical protein
MFFSLEHHLSFRDEMDPSNINPGENEIEQGILTRLALILSIHSQQ